MKSQGNFQLTRLIVGINGEDRLFSINNLLLDILLLDKFVLYLHISITSFYIDTNGQRSMISQYFGC